MPIKVSVAIDEHGKVVLKVGGKPADYIYAKPGQELSWVAATRSVQTFELEFWRVSKGGGGVGKKVSDWPFEADIGGDGKVGNHKVSKAKRVETRIAARKTGLSRKTGFYYYAITATAPDGRTVVFDPHIIIDW